MFRLTRFFSITSLTAFVIVSVLLGVFYRQAAIGDLITLGERNNVALTPRPLPIRFGRISSPLLNPPLA